MPRVLRRASRVAVAGLGVLAAAAPAAAQCPDGTPPPCRGAAVRASAPDQHSIAVLYFDNLSRDSADTYLADGLTDEVIVRLQHVQRLDVKSRYEVRRLRGTRVTDARSVGRQLHVAWLVTGSVRPGPARMRVSYELVRTGDGRAVVSDIVDTTAADQWAISNGVALAIARQVAGRLAPEERVALMRGPSRDAQAVDLYRRGTYLVDRGIGNLSDRSDVLWAVGFFRAAIERDSSFTDAWAALADAWTWVGDNLAPNRFASENARAAAQRALALDSTSDRAAAVLASTLTAVDYDWAGAERLLRRALALNPRSTAVSGWLSHLLTSTGRFDEAWRLVERAWEGDSLDPRLQWHLWSALVCARRYDDLLRWSTRVTWAREAMRVDGFLGTGRPDSALAASSNPFPLAIALAAAGRLAEARDSLARTVAVAESLSAEGGVIYLGAYDAVAMGWAAVGDRDRAFAALERAFAERSGNILPFVKYLPAFDPLRDDSRYHDLLRRMHLEP